MSIPRDSLQRRANFLPDRLCAVFLVGLVVTAFSFVRLKYIRGISMEPNLTRVFSFVGIYGNVEVSLSEAGFKSHN